MTKHPYKPVESGLSGDIFIIKAGLRIKKLGLFHSIEDARIKCDELNMMLIPGKVTGNKSDELNGTGL